MIRSDNRPIALLDAGRKVFLALLLEHLESWQKAKGRIVKWQTGFRKHRGTRLNGFLLKTTLGQVWNKKYYSIYLATIDFSAAFDCVNQRLLWATLQRWGIPYGLLWLIGGLYFNYNIQILFNQNGTLSHKISTFRGVRQGCVLATCLFNLYMSDIGEYLSPAAFATPKIQNLKLVWIAYADIFLLFDCTQIGLQHFVDAFLNVAVIHNLNVNPKKTKITHCTTERRKTSFNW